MPFFISVSITTTLAELTHFVKSNHGIVLFPGAYLLPWEDVPDVLTRFVRYMVPAATKVIVTAVTDYWSVTE